MPNCCKPATNAGANVHAVLADAAGEHDRVRPAQLDQHRSQIIPDAGHEHVQCQPRSRVAGRGRLLQVAHVAADAA